MRPHPAGAFAQSILHQVSPLFVHINDQDRFSVSVSDRTVVMVAYGFPPEGNAGVYRPLRFVRQLPSFGWRPVVVTAEPSQYERYDSTLAAKIPQQTEIIRIKGYDLWQGFQSWRAGRATGSESRTSSTGSSQISMGDAESLRGRLRGMIRLAEARWYHPDMASPWINPAVDAVGQVCRRERVSVIWATAGPVSAFYAAQLASRKYNIPYVLDFRDSWTITHNDFEARRPAWAIQRDRSRMFDLLQKAQAVIFRYEREAECYWQAYRGALEASKIYIIPNGYEPPLESGAASTGERCTLLYGGVVSDYRYDTFLAALAVLKSAEPSRAQQLRVLFVGEGMDIVAKEAATRGVSEMVLIAGVKRSDELAALQREADALLIFGRPATKPGYELFAGAKLFGYLKTGKPIIGVLPEDETKKVLQQVESRMIADVESIPEICRVLEVLLEHWNNGTVASLVPDRKACEAYASDRQTAILVRALEAVPAEHPFIPGLQTVPPSLRETLGDPRWLEGVSPHAACASQNE